MSGGAFGGARGVGSRPPEKGIFPLDHFGECKKVGRKRLGGAGPMRRAGARAPAAAPPRPAAQSRRCTPLPRRPGLQLAHEYLACLRSNDAEASNCKELSRKYLECRMER